MLRGLNRLYWGYIGIMENKMEATIVHCGSIGAQSVGARPFVNITCSGLTPAYVAMSASGQDA